MLSNLRSRLTYANVMASIAVFIALGGTSYGIASGTIGSREIGNNQVRSKDLRNNDVRGKDIRRGTIRSSDVADLSLLGADFAPGELPAGPRGVAGARGLAGDTGPQGPAGPTAAAVGDAQDPLAGPDATTLDGTTSLTTPSVGDVLAFGQMTLGMTCPAATFNCSFLAGLYLDGEPVPASAFRGVVPVGGSQLYGIDVFGLASDVPAGTHEITIGWKAISPNPASWGSQSGWRTGGLFLGG